jgi:hypothetical protein
MGPQYDITPLAFQADRPAVNQEKLVLIQVAMGLQRALAQKDAQHQVVDLSQVDHGERLRQPGALFGDADDLQLARLCHVVIPLAPA